MSAERPRRVPGGFANPGSGLFVARAHLQSEAEREAWAGARAAALQELELAREKARVSRAARAPRKSNPAGPSSARELVRLAAEGDHVGCLDLIESGARPNGRDAQGRTPLAICLDAGASMERVAVALLEAGGRMPPPRHSQAYGSFAAAVDAGPLAGKEAVDADERTVHACLARASSWSVGKVAVSECGGALGRGEVAAALGRAWRLDLACAFQAGGGRLGGPFWAGVAGKWEGGAFGGELGLASAPGFGPMLALIASGAESELLPVEACEALFTHAASRGDARLLCALLDGGLRPNPKWTARMSTSDAEAYKSHLRSSLLVACAAGASREAFDVARSCPAVVEAALALGDFPECLAAVPPSRLADLAALGVDLAAVDPDGRGLAHWWADNGQLVGWPTLSRVAPKAFELLDRSGRRGVDSALAGLEDEAARAAFQAMLARKEGREIARESERAPRRKGSSSRL